MTTEDYGNIFNNWNYFQANQHNFNVSCNLNYCITMGKKHGSKGDAIISMDNGFQLSTPDGYHFHQSSQHAKTAPCAYCTKERNKDADSKNRKHRRLVRTRLNSPIVVRLQDAIKVSVKGKGKATTTSKSGNASIISHDEDVVCKKETVSLNNSFASTPTEKSEFSIPKVEKNFNSFLSAIEKAHLKDDSIIPTASENLVDFVDDSKDNNKNNVLNNRIKCQNSITEKSSKRGLDTIDNIELICNDLSSKNSVAESESEDSEPSESSSVISSSDGSVSDSDISSTTDSLPDELSKEDLERLVDYTTGAPLTRYNCPPHECPECLAAYYAYTQWCYGYDMYSAGYQQTPTDVQFGEPCAACNASDDEEEASKVQCQVVVTGVKKVEVSVACLRKSKKKKHTCSSHKTPPTSAQFSNLANGYSELDKHLVNNSVSVDLTHSDVEFSIQYLPERHSKRRNSGHHHHHHHHQHNHHNHHNQYQPPMNIPFYHQHYQHLQNLHHHYHHHNTLSHGAPPTPPHTPPPTPQSPQQHQPFMYDDWSTYYPGYNNYGFLPYSMPYYMLPPYYCLFPFYTIPKPLCVPRDLRCLKSQRLCMVPAHEIKNFTSTQPPQRPWMQITPPERNKPVAIYTVMCYNVLCDKYATRQLYGYCPSWALAWEYRKKGIIEEIRHYNADIITLQEVETDQFYKFFLPELKKDGYDGIFAPKSRARTMSELDKKQVDGCAIFFRTTKFGLVKEHLIEFNQVAMAKADGSHEMLNRVMTKDNIALAALLETKKDVWTNGTPPENQISQPILVTTCHVHWDPEFSDVKLVQTMMLMSEIKSVLDEHTHNLRPGASQDANSIPLLLCGDLNSLPESGVLEYLISGRVAENHTDFKSLGYDKCLQKICMSDKKDYYTHCFKLAQAYKKETLPYTNYTFDFKGIIDYIFHARDSIRPLGVLGPLDANWFIDNKVLGCPHPHIPSDHMPLIVEFEMGPSANSSNRPLSQAQRPMASSTRPASENSQSNINNSSSNATTNGAGTRR